MGRRRLGHATTPIATIIDKTIMSSSSEKAALQVDRLQNIN